MIDLYKKLLFSQKTQILIFDRNRGDLITEVSLKNYPLFKNDTWIFLLNIPDLKKINLSSEKFKKGLKAISTADVYPEGSLINHRNEFSILFDNLYPYHFEENDFLLNPFVESKIIKDSADLTQALQEEIYELPPKSFLPEDLKQYGEVPSEIFSYLSKYFNFLYNNIYQGIIDTTNNLLTILTESFPNEQKIGTSFTVAEISLLFKLLRDGERLLINNKNDLFRKIAKYFTSKNNERISPDSVKNNFYTSDPNACREIGILLTQMQRRLEEL